MFFRSHVVEPLLPFRCLREKAIAAALAGNTSNAVTREAGRLTSEYMQLLRRHAEMGQGTPPAAFTLPPRWPIDAVARRLAVSAIWEAVLRNRAGAGRPDAVPGAAGGAKDTLKSLPFLARVADVEIDALTSAASARYYDEGDCIFARDDPADALYVISTGRVRIHRDAFDGDVAILGVHASSDAFGSSLWLWEGTNYHYTARAAGRLRVIAVPALAFRQLMRNNPEIGAQVRRDMVKALNWA